LDPDFLFLEDNTGSRVFSCNHVHYILQAPALETCRR
jgi:hypothetical protein